MQGLRIDKPGMVRTESDFFKKLLLLDCRLALEELPRKHNSTHSRPGRNTALLPEVSSEFAQVSLPDRRTSHSAPAAILHIRDICIEIFEDTSGESLTMILKAVQSC